ncbi:MAG: hypothetical protein RI958_976 [Actinomycetota bacterium]
MAPRLWHGSHGRHRAVTRRCAPTGTVASVETFIVRVWLPDRPGALGQVASRIGAVRGDVVGIDILERGGGRAVDELVVTVPGSEVLDLLVAEICQVDGVAVEEIRPVVRPHADIGVMVLEVAAELVESPAADRLAVLCARLGELVDATWVVALDHDTEEVLAATGERPDSAWLSAFLQGSRHLTDDHAGAPSDVAWGRLPVPSRPGETSLGVTVAVGRAGRAIHARERQQIGLFCRLVSALAEPALC